MLEQTLRFSWTFSKWKKYWQVIQGVCRLASVLTITFESFQLTYDLFNFCLLLSHLLECLVNNNACLKHPVLPLGVILWTNSKVPTILKFQSAVDKPFHRHKRIAFASSCIWHHTEFCNVFWTKTHHKMPRVPRVSRFIWTALSRMHYCTSSWTDFLNHRIRGTLAKYLLIWSYLQLL